MDEILKTIVFVALWTIPLFIVLSGFAWWEERGNRRRDAEKPPPPSGDGGGSANGRIGGRVKAGRVG